MLRRLGNKRLLIPKIDRYLPEHIQTFIDMFFGTGAASFYLIENKRCKHIIANDKDDDVFNLFMVLKNRRQELVESIKMMPVHESLFEHWKESQEYDQIWKATRFLMLSNFGYLGVEALQYRPGNDKQNLLAGIDNVFSKLFEAKMMSVDFREVLTRINWRSEEEKQQAFVYADPPYLGTSNNYAESFTEDDTRDLFSILTSSGIRFALSEFRHPLVMALAEEHGLHVTSLGERRNLKNRREEILITNYQPQRRQGSLFPSEGAAASTANKQRSTSNENVRNP